MGQKVSLQSPLQGSGFYTTPTRFYRWPQRHGPYGSTTQILNSAKGEGHTVSMKPEEKALPSRPTRPHTGVGSNLQLVTRVLAEHIGILAPSQIPIQTPKTKGLSLLSYVEDSGGSAPPPPSFSGDDDGLKLWGPSLPICAMNSARVLL